MKDEEAMHPGYFDGAQMVNPNRITGTVCETNLTKWAPIIINTDSTVAIAFATNTQLKTRMKHLDVRQHWISMIRDLSIARPIHCSSQNNIADLLTKIHPGPRFQQLVSKLMWTKTYY